MLDIHLPTLLLAAFPGLILQVLIHRLWLRRVRGLERDLQELSDVVVRMADADSRAIQRLSGSLADVEERLIDLSVPSEDPDLPLERRHRVLALARKGASAEEIAKKLNIPRGEVDLILSLRSCIEPPAPRAPRANGDVKRHVKVKQLLSKRLQPDPRRAEPVPEPKEATPFRGSPVLQRGVHPGARRE